jgi:hypothetical protein
VAEQPVLDVLRPEWLIEQRILLQVDHAQAEVIASSPVRFCFVQLFGAEGGCPDSGSSGSVWTDFEDFGWDADIDGAHG